MSRQSVGNYKKSGWLERIGQGAYKRKGDVVSWQGGLYALQKLKGLPVHVGGRTALELQGFAHYVKMSNNQVLLCKAPDVGLPTWFQKYEWEVNLEVQSATLFAGDVGAILQTKVENIELTISSVERAVLEYLYDVPKKEGFDEASYIMEGLSSLRPSVLQKLLEACNSIKVKRLFLYMAEYCNHAWFERVNSSSIDLGCGKRAIVKGGKLDKKYKIVVPKLSMEDR